MPCANGSRQRRAAEVCRAADRGAGGKAVRDMSETGERRGRWQAAEERGEAALCPMRARRQGRTTPCANGSRQRRAAEVCRGGTAVRDTSETGERPGVGSGRTWRSGTVLDAGTQAVRSMPSANGSRQRRAAGYSWLLHWHRQAARTASVLSSAWATMQSRQDGCVAAIATVTQAKRGQPVTVG